MKKISFLFMGIASFLLLVSCATTKFKYSEEMGTPENSVIFYGLMENNTITSFAQMDPNFEPDFQEMKSGFSLIQGYIVSNPVKPGSTYSMVRTKGSSGSASYGGWIWDSKIPMNLRNFMIKMPKEPGLYYIGYLSGLSTVSNGKYTEVYDGLFALSEEYKKLSCLKYVKEKYKGTVWEAVIDKEIEEIEK